MFGLIQAPDKGWAAPPTLAAFADRGRVLTLFVLWELHTDEPMLDMRYFRNPAFSVGSGGMMLVFLAMYGVMLLMTQYFQLVLGFSALDAAIRLLPDRADHDHRHAVHAAHRATASAPTGRSAFGMLLIALGFVPVHAGSASTRRSGTRGWRSSPLMTGHVDVDVADDGRRSCRRCPRAGPARARR